MFCHQMAQCISMQRIRVKLSTEKDFEVYNGYCTRDSKSGRTQRGENVISTRAMESLYVP